ncbi:MAG: TerC family protein, partial [Elusimicrobiota bacterium]|nr:TerC family protein [Elusimicrobiota bacterium]
GAAETAGAAPVAAARAALPRRLAAVVSSVLGSWTRGKTGAEAPLAAEMGALLEGPLATFRPGRVPRAERAAQFTAYLDAYEGLRAKAAETGKEGEAARLAAALIARPNAVSRRDLRAAVGAPAARRLKRAAAEATRVIARVWRHPTADPLEVRIDAAPAPGAPETLPQAMAALLDGPLAGVRTRRELGGLDRAGRTAAFVSHLKAFDALAAEARGTGERARAALVAAHLLARPRTMPYEELRYALGAETAHRLLALEAGARALGRRVGQLPLERLHAAVPRALETAERRVLLGVPAKGAPFRLSWRLVGVILLLAPGKTALVAWIASQFIPGFDAAAWLAPLLGLPTLVVAGAPVWLWGAFAAGVAALFTLDLKVFGKAALTTRAALWQSALWFGAALAFGAGVWLLGGADLGTEFLAAYLLEKSLSVDNLAVFIALFGAAQFAVPASAQSKLLSWGIMGAIALRLAMIAGGTTLMGSFAWMPAVFAGVLLLAAYKMFNSGEEKETDRTNGPLLSLLKRVFPITDEYRGDAFRVVEEKREGKRYPVLRSKALYTRLALALVAVMFTDLVFAVDSIPAVLAITPDPFIVVTSNIAALMGLRALFFLIKGMMERFHLLNKGLALILSFVALKMTLALVAHIHLPIALSLAVIVSILAATIGLSLAFPKKEAGAPAPGHTDETPIR